MQLIQFFSNRTHFFTMFHENCACFCVYVDENRRIELKRIEMNLETCNQIQLIFLMFKLFIRSFDKLIYRNSYSTDIDSA